MKTDSRIHLDFFFVLMPVTYAISNCINSHISNKMWGEVDVFGMFK